MTCASRAHSYKRSKEIANHMAGLYLRSVASLLPSAAGSAIIAAGSAINTFQEERTALPQVYPLKKLFVGFFFRHRLVFGREAPKAKTWVRPKPQ